MFLRKYARLILGVVFFALSIGSFIYGQIFLGLLSVLVSAIFVLIHFRNEYMLVAFYYLRKQDIEKAHESLLRIKHPDDILVHGQLAYYYFLLGTCESKQSIFKAEKYYKKALSLGLRLDHDIAMAKLSLAAVVMGRGNKREAQILLAEAKKYDKTKMLTEQIKMLEKQMSMVGMQKVAMQSHQGRKRI
jgi:tetratricopeptide (TPR) repeat protein